MKLGDRVKMRDSGRIGTIIAESWMGMGFLVKCDEQYITNNITEVGCSERGLEILNESANKDSE
jgi:hypothetical protein